MDRRPHPTYDRDTLTRSLAWFALALGGPVAAVALRGVVGDTPATVAALVLLAVGVVGLMTVPVNRSPCPGCGAILRRPAGTTEFPCPACGVAWVTRSYGASAREGDF